MASESHQNQINPVFLRKPSFSQKNRVFLPEKPGFSEKLSFSGEKLGFSEKLSLSGRKTKFLGKTKFFSRKTELGFSNSGDFCVRKIGCSKLHSVLPMNENEFRFSEVSYHLKKPNFLKGAFRTLGMLPRE